MADQVADQVGPLEPSNDPLFSNINKPAQRQLVVSLVVAVTLR